MRSIASNYGHELRDLPEIQGNATAFNSYPTGPWQLMGTNLAIVGFWPIRGSLGLNLLAVIRTFSTSGGVSPPVSGC